MNYFPFLFLPLQPSAFVMSTFVMTFNIVTNLIHALGVMWLPVFETQYDDAYVLIDAIKTSLWELKVYWSISTKGDFSLDTSNPMKPQHLTFSDRFQISTCNSEENQVTLLPFFLCSYMTHLLFCLSIYLNIFVSQFALFKAISSCYLFYKYVW